MHPLPPKERPRNALVRALTRPSAARRRLTRDAHDGTTRSLTAAAAMFAAIAWAVAPHAKAGPPTDRAIADCRALAEAARRLACYDAIPLAAGAAAAPVSTHAAAATAPAAGTGAAAAVAASPAEVAAQHFGMPSRGEATSNRLDTHIDGIVDGWGPRTQFKLANGQVWEVEDGSSAAIYLRSPKVSVRRGFAGAYYLELEGSNRTPRVRRVR